MSPPTKNKKERGEERPTRRKSLSLDHCGPRFKTEMAHSRNDRRPKMIHFYTNVIF